MAIEHPNYGLIARRVELSRLYKRTPKSFAQSIIQASQGGLLSSDFQVKAGRIAARLDGYIVQRYDDNIDLWVLSQCIEYTRLTDVSKA